MYGLVNQAIQDMICQKFGEPTWQEIKCHAQVEGQGFLSMEAYPDDLTHRLVRAASVVLSLSPAEVMQAFGEYWVLYTAEEGYGELLEMAGESLPEFLQNLDELHARVGVMFPKLQPPSFDCEEEDDRTLRLQYSSHREGLAPMVVGLVKGLGDRFETSVEITQIQSKAEGAQNDEFLVHHRPEDGLNKD
ncbi:heme NO-binding domain-containing protein [Roseofilum casamattae]|uniref:Heme NO-binding domain-containing protein n=1 Tax=Roseofilum casamattae BLCC-M143 TaxID=3022442 RepID=A0ABT7C1K8_9CYAN|nr:heme NO-binding domain-containing protein [Roseofilum casamattae]MDJ1184581.1 heme NO-binding domain-containing protein [Roseofilum casamattae BLCC-M143]